MTQEKDSLREKHIAAVVDALIAERFVSLDFLHDATPEEIIRILQKAAGTQPAAKKAAETRGN